MPTEAMGFHTTHWPIVLSAAARDGTTMCEALASLCATYWYLLYAFVRRQGLAPHEVEDLTQEFFCRFLERNALASVRPNAGRFLLVCLKNFPANERERAGAQCRGGGCVLPPLETGEAENRDLREPVEHLTPETIFERHWAFAVLERTIDRVDRVASRIFDW